MPDIAIKVQNLSKRYRIGLEEEIHDTFAGALTDFVTSPIRNFRRLRRLSRFDDGRPGKDRRPTTDDRSPVPRLPSASEADDIIWALRDVSFEVERGEVVGVIGRNGAGKSTLLKILSRITHPTSGRVELNGRVSSLLEVGTGFHQELTGRENIYLNGTILGMTKAEVDRKFDEIVDFSGVEKFIDTPVKRYSSGMRVRLAFSVAAHLEPEILLVDEVLAVGDAEFQKKCLGKMGEVAGEGRTVLFVSHNMTAVQSLCDRAILLNKGSVIDDGESQHVVSLYLENNTSPDSHKQPGVFALRKRENQYGDGDLIIRELHLLDSEGELKDSFLMGEDLQIVIETMDMSKYPGAEIGVIIKSKVEQWITSISSSMNCKFVEKPRNQHEEAKLFVSQIPLTPNSYWIDVSIAQPGIGRIDYVEKAAKLLIEEADVYGTGRQISSYFGMFYLDGYWRIESHRDN